MTEVEHEHGEEGGENGDGERGRVSEGEQDILLEKNAGGVEIAHDTEGLWEGGVRRLEE